MSKNHQSLQTEQEQNAANSTPGKLFRILVVEADSPTVETLSLTAAQDPLVRLAQANNVEEAHRTLAKSAADVVMIDPSAANGHGLALAQEIARTRPQTQTILVTDQPDTQQALEAMRCGVADFLVKPLTPDRVRNCIEQAKLRHRLDLKRVRQIHKLKRRCRKLDLARIQISKQVDVLCNDLVTAYQELSTQMTQAVCAGEFNNLIRVELNLQSCMQKTLEYLQQKAGPTNIALFLPASPGEFALAAYVNEDCSASAADILLQHLADVVAPKVAQQVGARLISDNQELAQWIGDDWNYLADSQVLTVPCRHKQETLAVLVLFRDASTPFTPSLQESAGVIAPLLGDHLARVVRIHHRHLPDADPS